MRKNNTAPWSSRYGSEALGTEASSAWRQECEKTSGGGGGPQAVDSVTSVVGNRGSLRTAAQQPRHCPSHAQGGVINWSPSPIAVFG